jgi:nitrile hydratase
MNGIHDLGGMHGLGPILTEENEPYFHHEWERRVFPLFASLFVGGHFNVDEFRHAIERMDPAHYLEASYYEHWLHAFETLLLEKGVITVEELWGGATAALRAWHACADAGDGGDGCQYRRVCARQSRCCAPL